MILDRIVASKRAEIEALKAHPPAAPRGQRRFDVCGLLARAPGEPLRIMAEFKRKSPSAGELSKVLTLSERMRAYARAGASMVSVLCDGPFFGGSFEDVKAASTELAGSSETSNAGRPVPILAKEFILDEVQLHQAAAHGADAALLIVRILTPEQLARLIAAARGAGLEPLVEIANDEELRTTLATDARLIGVNARDLDTLRMDPERAARLVAAIPRDRIALHLSGLKTEEDVRAVAGGRADGALIGEILMRQDDPTDLLSRLVGAAK